MRTVAAILFFTIAALSLYALFVYAEGDLVYAFLNALVFGVNFTGGIQAATTQAAEAGVLEEQR